jgi:hypothetical protein
VTAALFLYFSGAHRALLQMQAREIEDEDEDEDEM